MGVKTRGSLLSHVLVPRLWWHLASAVLNGQGAKQIHAGQRDVGGVDEWIHKAEGPSESLL